MKKAFAIGGILASIILIAFGIGSLVVGTNGRDEVRSSLVRENVVGSAGNRIREFVLPIRNVGPAIDSPSAATSFRRPSAVCVSPRIVTGPSRTFISIERPAPALP